MENQQKKLQEELESVVEHSANIEENLSKVKQEQDNLNNQLKGLLILERIERSQRIQRSLNLIHYLSHQRLFDSLLIDTRF